MFPGRPVALSGEQVLTETPRSLRLTRAAQPEGLEEAPVCGVSNEADGKGAGERGDDDLLDELFLLIGTGCGRLDHQH
jgi:hypothetical protein